MSAREAWREVCMAEYRITGDMVKATAFADSVEQRIRAEILRERAEKAREFMGPETMPYESEANARYVLGWHAAVKYMAEESS